jgi:hypothetical protein
LLETLHVGTLAFAAFGLRVGTYLLAPGNWPFESMLRWDGWGRIALFMAHGHGLADTHALTYFPIGETPVPTAARPPLPIIAFAAILRLFGERLLPIVVWQCLLEAGTTVVLYLIMRRLCEGGAFGPALATGRSGHQLGLLAATGYACFEPGWAYAIGFQSEPICTTLLTTALGLLILGSGRGRLVAAGLLFGLAALARPEVIWMPFLLLPWLVRSRSVPWKRAIVVPLLMVLVLVPWGLRNYVQFKLPLIAGTVSGYALYRHSGIAVRDNLFQWVSHATADAEILAALEDNGLSPKTATEAEIDRFLTRETVRIILKHPGRYLRLCLDRVVGLFHDADRLDSSEHPLLRPVRVGTNTLFFGFGLLALWRYRGAWVERLVPLWIVSAYTVVVHALTVAQFRYLLPLVPLLTVPSAYGLWAGWTELRRTRRLPR